MTLYLKYRPQKLEELDSVSVRESLKKIFSGKNIPHAFLFAGPKGTGKTSTARIIAKILNCEKLGGSGEPCDTCEQCVSISQGSNLDVIELDAASNRGIDDVRTLRDAVKLAPAKSKKKVYIIDEAHMLTTEASNALLKTLEEPPSHVVFILATTNPEKLIETIRSRVTQVVFKKASVEELVSSLKKVVKGEKLKIEDSVLTLIAKSSNGAFRDATKILEQVVAEKIEKDEEKVKEFLSGSKSFNVEEFVNILLAKKEKEALGLVSSLAKEGVQMELVIKETLENLNKLLLTESRKEDLVFLIEFLIEASEKTAISPIEELPLEIAIVKFCKNGEVGEEKGTVEKEPTEVKMESKPEKKIETESMESFETGDQKDLSDVTWKEILTKVRPINASIEALLRAARPVGYDGKNLTLGVFYKFHKERLEDAIHRRILEDVIASVLGTPTRVVCTLAEPPVKKTVLTESSDNDIIKAAEEIFSN